MNFDDQLSEQYQYDRGTLKGSNFRLLTLLKNTGFRIRCKLSEFSHTAYPDYEALSYTWGSPLRLDEIELNEKPFRVTENLYAALYYLQSRQTDRTLWVDAICINQDSHEERGHQVQQMADIFHRASKVIFWLGKTTLEESISIAFLKRLEHSETKSHFHWELDQIHGSHEWDNVFESLNSGFDWHRDGGDLRRRRCALYRHILSLFERPWFERIWIVQEVEKSQQAIVACGAGEISSSLFVVAPLLLDFRPNPTCQAILDLMPGPRKEKPRSNERPDLLTLLQRFKASKATDQRDKIYALLGLSSKPDDKRIVPDYNKPIEQVLQEAFSHLIEFSHMSLAKTLELLPYFSDIDVTFLIGVPDMRCTVKGIHGTIFEEVKIFKTMQILPHKDTRISVSNHKDTEFSMLLEQRTKTDQRTCYAEAIALLSQNHRKTPPEKSVQYSLQIVPTHIENYTRDATVLAIENTNSAIVEAASEGLENIVQLLLQCGAKAEKAFEVAAGGVHESVIKLLLLNGAPNALQESASRGYKAHVEYLLREGADINAQTKELGSATQTCN